MVYDDSDVEDEDDDVIVFVCEVVIGIVVEVEVWITDVEEVVKICGSLGFVMG